MYPPRYEHSFATLVLDLLVTSFLLLLLMAAANPVAARVPALSAALRSAASPVGPGTYEDNHSEISYTGTWTSNNNANASGGTVAYSTANGALALLQVSGAASFYIRTVIGANQGISKVLLDGVVI